MKIERTPVHASRLLRAACYATLAALALMTWQLFDPRPLPVLVAMSAGQALGTLSLVAFGYIILRDLRAARRAARESVDQITPD